MGRRPGPSLGREDVIKAALKVVQEDGAAGLGVNRVARELGIKPPSIYNHIKNGNELRNQVAIAGWDKLYESLKPGFNKAKDPESQLRSLFEGYRHFAGENPALYEVMSQVAIPSNDPQFQDVARRILGLFRGILHTHGIKGATTVHTLRAIRSVIHGFILLESNQQFDPNFDADASYEWIITLMMGALRANAG